jgi:peroxiredoxin
MFREGLRPPDPFREIPPLEAARTQDGMSLQVLSELSPVLVVCLPTLGERRCREMLKDVAASREAIERAGTRLAMVHMGSEAEAAAELARHDLQYTARISDPKRQLYAFFELGTKRKGLLRRSEKQMPGAFLLSMGKVVKSHRAATPPDYRSLAPEVPPLA